MYYIQTAHRNSDVSLFFPIAVWFIVRYKIPDVRTSFPSFRSDCQLRLPRHFDWKLLRLYKQLLNFEPELRLEKEIFASVEKRSCRKTWFFEGT
jgi:hypothetical protein